MLQSMTKETQLNLSSKLEEDNFLTRGENSVSQSSHAVSDPYLLNSSEEKASKKPKRKATSTATKNNVCSGEKKKSKAKSSNSHQKSDNPLPTKVRKRIPSNFARLAPLLHRSCPDNLLQIESFKSDKQDSNKENSSSPQFVSFEAPVRPRRFQGGTSKRVQIFEKQRKKRETLNSSSSTVIQDTAPAKSLLERNCSTPNLLVTSLCDKSKRSELLFSSSSLTVTSEFPDVAQFYENEFLRSKLPHCLKSAGSKRNWNSQFISSLLSIKNPIPAFVPYPKTPLLNSSSSQSAPNTPPTLRNIKGRVRKGRYHLPLGAVASCNSFQGSGGSEFSNGSFAADENSIKTQSEFSSATVSEEDKQFSENTRNLFVSIRKAMNSKSNQQISANHKSSQPLLQYHTGRARPRVANNFSSSFILPYGLGGRVQSSPVSTPAVPNSSSFHGGPLESLQLMSDNHRSTVRQQSQCSNGQRQRKYLDRQKLKILKPLGVNKNQNNIAKLYDISTSEFSAAILPETGTTSYRLTHDVSFDEGSRYRTSDFPHGLKGKDDPRVNGLSHQFGSSISMRGSESFGATSQSRQEGRNREHTSTNNATYKDAVPLSLIRMEDRCDLPPAASPSSPAMSSAVAASTSASSFIPPPSASRPNPTNGTTTAGGNITFRLHKEKQNWNYRLGELSINGGGYTNPAAVSSNPKQEIDAINPINMTSAVQRNLQTRERAMAAIPKSRMSSRYSSKLDSNGAGVSYSDPCISAPPSFQQRLTDLSLLESETIKYERNRKLRRKKNQDKDS